MAKYRIIEPEDFNNYEQLARISFNLRYFSKIWKEHYGATNRSNMMYWEGKLDEWLNKNIEQYILEENNEEKVVNINERWQKIMPKQNKGDLSLKMPLQGDTLT